MKFIGLIAVFLATIAFTACGKSKLSFEKEEITVSIGTEQTLPVNVADTAWILEWSSSDEAIVTVNEDGKISAIAIGDVTITVSVKDKEISATIKIIVTDYDGTMSFSEESVNIIIDEEYQLEQLLSDSVPVSLLSWESDDTDVAEVDENGKVTGISEGTATVTASLGGKNAAIAINVGLPDPVGVIINGASPFAKMLSNMQLEASVIPNLADQGVDWSSSDTDIAVVDENGLVEFFAMGQVTITATSKAKSSFSHSVTIEVIEPDPTSITITTETGSQEVFLYGYLQLTAQVMPEQTQQVVTWTISDSQIATVSSSGRLYGSATGTVTVTATSNIDESVFATIEIAVIQPEPLEIVVEGKHSVIQIEEELQLSVSVFPELSDQNVLFTSSDSEIATVDADGKIVGVAAGEAVITVKSQVLETLTETYAIKVVPMIEEPEHTRILFNSEYAAMERYTFFTDGGAIYYVGINAFADLEDINIKEGAELFFYPGIYNGTLAINQNKVMLKSLNSQYNPNTDNYVKSNQAIITGTILLADGVSEITVDGLSFTGAGKLRNEGTVSDFIFINNNLFDIDASPVQWSAFRNYELVGAVTLWKLNTSVNGIVFENNRFENVLCENIVIGNITDAVIKNNVFLNFTHDAIRIDGGYNYGFLEIENNVFENDETGTAHNGIYFRALGSDEESSGNPHNVLVKNNTFKNLGVADTIYSGAISSSSYQEYGLVINVVNNTFETCLNYIMLRNNASEVNHSSYDWIGNINYNVFLGMPVDYYYINRSGEEAITTNPALVNMDYNFFGDAAGNYLNPEDMLEKFINVASLEGSFTDMGDINALYVDVNLDGTAAGVIVEVQGMELEFGERVFARMVDAIEKAGAGSIIIVLPGMYNEVFDIDKALTIKSLNAGFNPTVDDDVFKPGTEDVPTNAAVFSAAINLKANNILLQGLTFTGEASITSDQAMSNFKFVNNYVFDTAATDAEWTDTTYYDSGFIRLAIALNWQNNTLIQNNKFENVNDCNVYIKVPNSATITGNVFEGFGRDAVRFDYTANYGRFLINDNTFIDGAYNGIYFRRLSWAYAASDPRAVTCDVDIYNNYFENVGTAAETASPTKCRIGAIVTTETAESSTAPTFIEIDIRYNYFKDCANYISIRNNYNINNQVSFEAEIMYNAFIDSNGVDYYHINLFGTDTTESNHPDAVINHNFYGISETEAAIISEEQFGHCVSDGLNETVYQNYDDLLAAIDAIGEEYELAADILVDESLADVEEDDEIIYNNYKYIVGINAFAALADAMAVAEEGTTIIVLPGVYGGDIIISKNNVSLIGSNAGIDPDLAERGPEAFIDGKITLGTGVKDITINGFSFNYLKTEKFITGEAEGQMDGFTFVYNIVDGADSGHDGANGFIQFIQVSAEAGVKNFTIKYNHFTNFNSDRIIRLAFIENLEITGNVFTDGTSDAIRLRDGGGGISGKLVLKDNVFTNIGQYAFFAGPYNATEISITGNIFNNCGYAYGGGALSFRDGDIPEGGMYIEVTGNVFNGSNMTDIRFDHLATDEADLEIVVCDNEFRVPDMTYYTNNNAAAAVKTVFYGNKIFGSSGELLNPATLTDKIINAQIGLSAPTIYVDQALEDMEDGSAVTLDDIEGTLIFGTDVFNDVEAAVAALQPGGTLFLLPGEYNKTINIAVSHVTITTLNGEINPNNPEADRYPEAISREDFYIKPYVINVTLKGLMFKHYSQLFIQNNTENIVIKNNIFSEDYFTANRPAIDVNAMLAWGGTYAKMVKYLTIEDNLFDNIHTREAYADKNYTVRGIGLMYTENLIVRNNVMNGFGENYLYGLYGKTVIENNEFLNCRYRAVNLVNVMDDIDILNNKFSMASEPGQSTRVIYLWYSGTWYNGADGSSDFYRDDIFVNVKFNDVVIDSDTVRVFSLDPSVKTVDGSYVFKYNYQINCNYNSVTGELSEESALVFTDNNKLNAKFNYWGSATPDSANFKYGLEPSLYIDYSEFFGSKEALEDAIANLQ